MLVIPTAEGRRLGPSLAAVPTPERRQAATRALVRVLK